MSMASINQDQASASGHQHSQENHRSHYQKLYNAFGFSKAYNFPLYVICAGALFGLCLSRLENFNFDRRLSINVRPGQWFYLSKPGSFRYGMIMHIAGAVPAGLLQIFQFTPIIRRRFLKFHRINGYLILILILLSNAGVGILIRRPETTDIAWQTIGSILIFLTTFSGIMALYNIKRLQIDQHRAWMLRCVFYLGTAVTFRCIIFSGARIITRIGGFYDVWPCDKIDFTYQQYGFTGILPLKYPQCLTPKGTLNGEVVVPATWDEKAPESTGAAFGLLFGPALWISLLVHLVGLEIYLALTPREAARLRQLSYEKQLAAGYRSPGYAGCTVERWGDAEKWQPEISSRKGEA